MTVKLHVEYEQKKTKTPGVSNRGRTCMNFTVTVTNSVGVSPKAIFSSCVILFKTCKRKSIVNNNRNTLIIHACILNQQLLSIYRIVTDFANKNGNLIFRWDHGSIIYQFQC